MVEDKGIELHVPVPEKFRRTDRTFLVSDFKWDEQANEYRCPRGEPLRSDWRAFRNPRTHITHADTIVYRSTQLACQTCPLKPRCCPNTRARHITTPAACTRSHATWPARVPTTADTRSSRKDRKKVEVLFAHLKRILKLDPRLRLRGRRGARDEFLLDPPRRRTCDEWRSDGCR